MLRADQGTGPFALIHGGLATVVGIGAAFSTTFGSALIQHFSYRASFLGLAAVAVLAVALLSFTVLETLNRPAAAGIPHAHAA